MASTSSKAAAATSNPFFVLVPGGSCNPSQYGLLFHLLQSAGYPTFSSTLPTLGIPGATMQEDVDYIAQRMILPILDNEQKDVILISHSYSGLPASAACMGLSKAERAAKGHKTSVIGQISFAALLFQGGSVVVDGQEKSMSLMDMWNGPLPSFMKVSPDGQLVQAEQADRLTALYADVKDPVLANAAAASQIPHANSAFTSALPSATFHLDVYKGRFAYIRTTWNDPESALPFDVQEKIVEGLREGEQPVELIVTEALESGHCPQITQPEKLAEFLVKLAERFVALP